MTLYRYRYINPQGKKKRALIEAEGIQEAKEKLRLQKILLLALEESHHQQGRFTFMHKHELKGAHLVAFTTQLASLLHAGMPLYEGLVTLEEQYRKESFHPILLSLCEHINGGSSLSHAMQKFPKSFGTLYCALVASGESVGILATALEKLAQLLQKQSKLKKQIITTLLYPAVLVSFSLIVCVLLMTFLLPSLEGLFADHHLNAFTTIVLSISHFLTRKWVFYLPPLIALLCSLLLLCISKRGQRILQHMSVTTPILKKIIIHSALARFCRTMATLLEGGVAIIESLRIARRVMGNPLLEQVIADAEVNIVQGNLLSRELKKSPYIPPLLPRLLAVAEEGGTMALMFDKIAYLYEEELEKILSRMIALAQPLILVVMGAIVGMIMLAVLLPLTDMNAFF